MKLTLTFVMALALPLAACASLLGLKGASSVHPFEHRAHVDKGVSCVTCHAGVGESGRSSPLHLPSSATCRTCHAKPHDARECSACHGEPSVRGEAELAHEHLRFDHRSHMAGVHGDCVRCHVGAGDTQPVALRPAMATCFGCHEHRDQWTTRDCDACHVDLHEERTPPTSHVVHDGDFLREHGVRAASARDLCASCHTERACAACHGVGTTPGLPARLAFDDMRLDGLHRAGFKSRHSDEARAQPGLCITCHSEATCQGCHASSKVAASAGRGGGAGAASGTVRSPHGAGWLTPNRGGGEHGARARMDPMGCASCHGGAGEQLCVSCHRVGGPGGNPHGIGFSSTKDRRHDTPCRLCHGAAP